MSSRPAHLTRDNAARFQDQSVVDAYPLRLPYASEVFDVLVDLVSDECRVVLDVGTGTGELARPLAARLDRVDAVDASAAMIAMGMKLPGGDHPRLHWIEGRIEDAPLWSPYGLITTGDSLHWMDWDVVLPRFREIVTPDGLLAIVHRTELPPPWHEGLSELIAEYSTMQNFQRFDLVEELERRRLFTRTGAHETAPVTSRQSIEDYIESFHSRSSLSRENMPPAASAAFDDRLRKLVQSSSNEGTIELQTLSGIVWGLPHTE
jgi:SAM-dependent methyltransferase